MKIGYGMTFNQVLLGSYAGLRGAVGLSLALMVVQSDKISDYVKNVILLHVAGVALLTLLINATTTGMVVNYLHLADYSDLKKNQLISLSMQIDRNIDAKIKQLKTQKRFCFVDFRKMKEKVNMGEL